MKRAARLVKGRVERPKTSLLPLIALGLCQPSRTSRLSACITARRQIHCLAASASTVITVSRVDCSDRTSFVYTRTAHEYLGGLELSTMLLGQRLLRRTVGTIRWHSSTPSVSSRREFKVVLDGETLYVEQPLAEALGWNPDTPAEKGVSLTLSGWAPNYFAIARTGADSGT